MASNGSDTGGIDTGVFGPVRVRLAAGSRVGMILGTAAHLHCQHHQALGRVAEHPEQRIQDRTALTTGCSPP